MFEAAVDGFGGAVAGVEVVEVGQDVPGSAFECPAQRDELGQAPRYERGGQCVNFGFHHGLTRGRVGRTVGTNDVLVGAPGDLERNVLLIGKQVESWCCSRGVSRQDLVCKHPAGLVEGSVARPRRR